MENSNFAKEKSLFFTIFFSCIIFYAIFKKSVAAPTGNMFYYVVGCGTFVVFYFIQFFLFRRFKIKIGSKILLLLFSLGEIVWLVNTYLSETSIYPGTASSFIRHQIPFILYLLFMIGAVCTFQHMTDLSFGMNRKFRIIMMGTMILLQSILLYAPNIFMDGGGKIYHAHAYYNSIFNVLHHQPFSDINCSIYGHYAMFYYLPVKILNLFGVSDLIGVSICVVVVGAITFTFVGLILEKLVKNDFFLLLVGMANVVISTQIYGTGEYYQVLPHRLLFPAIILYFVLLKLDQKRIYNFVWVLCVFSLIWNFESGMICCIVWFVCSLCTMIQKNIKLKSCLKSFLVCVMFLLLSFVLAYVIVNMFNLILGGHWNSILTYIYPIGSEVYQVEDLALPLTGIFSLYFLEIILFLGSLCYVILSDFLKKQIEDKSIFILCNSLMGLGLLMYYMNRAAYCNIAITHINFIVCLCILFCVEVRMCKIKDIINLKKELTEDVLKGNIRLLSLVLVSAMALAGVTNISGSMANREQTWNLEKLADLCEEINRDVPNETVAFGIGVPEIYAYLKRDTNVYMIDWSDLNDENIQFILKRIENEDAIFVNQRCFEYIDCSDVFEVVNEYKINEEVFQYCKRIK